ncbi:A52R family protein [Swinepox virus]|uniref:A52R family protein n=1 Tax=Swinepox virus TaxID=10276 RepID=A0A881SXY3_SWPV|nr:A52R family protein [Swinepox virus]
MNSYIVIKNSLRDYRSGRIIRKYIRKLNKDEYKHFCAVFRLNVDFSQDDKNPSRKEVIRIIDEEFNFCDLRLFYDIMTVVANHMNVASIIYSEYEDLLKKSNYKNKKINYTILDKINKYHSIDDIIFMYLHWRKKYNNTCSCGKLFKELMKYDILATKYMYNDIINTYKEGDTISISIRLKCKDDIIKHCKSSIGMFAILSSKIINVDFDVIFFSQISIRYRLIFKKYLIQSLYLQ